MNLKLALIGITLSSIASASFDQDLRTINEMSGCYLIDYNFTEIESLKAGYVIDERVYDTNSDKTTYELVIPITKSPTELRLQHILFVKDLQTGEVGGMIKHQAEDWAYESAFTFDFITTGLWNPIKVVEPAGKWTRKITNLDDGLRYQCASAWDHSKANPEWNCANFAPIPGRETRDMGRKDYQALDRSTRLISYDKSWVERQNNVKTILDGDTRIPLARELGRTWLIEQDANACTTAQQYFNERKDFWSLLMTTWEEYLSVAQPFSEKARVNNQSRYGKMLDIEERYFASVSANATARENARLEIKSVIEEFRNEVP